MKKYLDAEFIVLFFWYCIMQPLLFFFCVAVFANAIFQSIMGTL